MRSTATSSPSAGPPTRPPSRSRDLATVDRQHPQPHHAWSPGRDELEEILEKPFDAWRVFLHPSQRRVAYRTSYGGPVQVTGGPGTGKTVAALHRVKHLLGRSRGRPRPAHHLHERAGRRTCARCLALLLDDDEKLLARVDVTTVDAFAQRHRARALAGRAHADRGPGTAAAVGEGGQAARSAVHRTVPGPGVPARRTRPGPARPATPTSARAARPRHRPRPRSADARCGAPSSGSTSCCATAASHTPAASAPGRRNSSPAEPASRTPTSSSTRHRTCTPPSGGCCAPPSPPARTTCSSPATRTSGSTTPGSRSAPWASSTAGRSFRLRVNYRSTEEILAWSARLLAPVTVDALGGEGRTPGRLPLPAARAPPAGTGVRDAAGGDRGAGGTGPGVARRRASHRTRSACAPASTSPWTRPRRS